MSELNGATSSAHPSSSAYRLYILLILTLTYVMSYADRNLIAVTQEQMKLEFQLADWQLGFLGGSAFAILYAVFGIPLARLAEHRNRMTIVAVSLAIWSMMTTLCGLATSVGMLLIGRIGVGVGEAGCSPPIHSILSNYFPQQRRTWALAVYSSGMPIGTMLAALAGGWIAHAYGWRAVFLWLGAPGVALALLVKFSGREPRREQIAEGESVPSFGDALRALLSRGTYRYVVGSAIVASFVNAGLVQFTASFFMRTHHFSLQQATLVFGLGEGIFAFAGTLAGGAIVDRFERYVPRIAAWVSAGSALACGLLYAMAFHTTSATLAIVALMLASFFRWLLVGPAFGMMQGVTPDRSRATALAVYLVCTSLIGAGFGALSLGACSDMFATAQLKAGHVAVALCGHSGPSMPEVCAAAHAQGLQLAMTLFCIGYGLCAVMFLRAATFMSREYKLKPKIDAAIIETTTV